MSEAGEQLVYLPPGWYDWEWLYERAAADAPPGARLVEVGVFCGRSLSHLARLARDERRGLRVVGVDTFRGSPEFDGLVFGGDGGTPWADLPTGTLAGHCVWNLERAGVIDDVALVVADSAAAAALVPDGSCWLVFLDADHTEAGVARDIAAWLPKVAPGGYLGGHDYGERDFPGVKAAVDKAFGSVGVSKTTWCVRKGGAE